MRLSSFLVLVSLLETAAAQTRLATPALGYVYDPSLGGIRAIRGIPGAALLADVVETGLELTGAEVSPAQNFALAVSASDRRVRLIRWFDGQAPSVTLLPDAMEAPGRLIFSPSGSAALLQDSESRHWQVVTGLPESPVVQEIAATASSAMALADDGAGALAGAEGVRFFGPDRSSLVLPLSADVHALAFSRSGRDLIAITRSGDLYLARNLEVGVDIRKIPYGSSPLANPVAVRFSPDGTSVFAADRSGRVVSILLENGDTREAACGCASTDLQPLGQRGLLRVTDISDQPLLLFDPSADRPRFWFVPMADRRSAQ